jgi:hypothetical protein
VEGHNTDLHTVSLPKRSDVNRYDMSASKVNIPTDRTQTNIEGKYVDLLKTKVDVEGGRGVNSQFATYHFSENPDKFFDELRLVHDGRVVVSKEIDEIEDKGENGLGNYYVHLNFSSELYEESELVFQGRINTNGADNSVRIWLPRKALRAEVVKTGRTLFAPEKDLEETIRFE